MGTRFHAPEGHLSSNIGLLAGTVIRELRIHPYIDSELEGVPWNHKPEYLEFTILSIQTGGYLCQYSGKTETFGWPAWKKQPNFGYLGKNSATSVRYYIQDAPLPLPYESKQTDFSPYSLRCAEIDQAALLVKDKNAFAALAAEPEVSHRAPGVFRELPSKKFFAEGGCPRYQGELNYGSGVNILCEDVQGQLYSYVGLKFCEGGRKIYCPIWQAEHDQQIVPNLGTKDN